MIQVNIDNVTLLNMLLDRVASWTTDSDIMELYETYYQDLIDCGCFEGCEFNPMIIVDNDYVNYLNVVSKDELSNYNIDLDEDENTDKIVACLPDRELYLVRTY